MENRETRGGMQDRRRSAPATEALRHRVQRRMACQQALHDPLREPRNNSPRLPELRRWQLQRLGASFAPLLEDARTRAVAEFFLTDLYGDKDFSTRDRDIARVLPLMMRLLPESLIVTVADAIALSALSHAFDLRMADALARMLPATASIDVDAYARAYRKVGLQRLRHAQIALIGRLGHGLDAAVRKPGLNRLLKMSRLPARAAGLGELQSFLERGFAAFATLGRPAAFVDGVVARELEVSRKLFAGTSDPFVPSG
jgi:hypothetical protein